MSRSDHWDFLRGLSMLSMFILNAAISSQWYPFGWNVAANSLAMVEPIIFLSGFLICLRTVPQVTSGQYDKSEIMKRFALRRIVRTWPLYFLLVAVCFIWPPLADRPITQPLWSFLTFTMNIDLPPRTGLVSMWTLCVEEWCYLIFLLLIPFFVPRRSVWIFLGLALACIMIRIGIIYKLGPFFKHTDYMTYLKFPTWSHCDSFFFGCAFAELYRERGNVSRRESYVSLGLAAGVVGLYYSLVEVSHPFFQITIPMWGATVSALLIWGLPVVNQRWLRFTGLVQLGQVSFTIYLIHKIVIERFLEWNRGAGYLPAQSFVEIVGAFAMTCFAGAILFWLLERHILTLLRRPFFRPTPLGQT